MFDQDRQFSRLISAQLLIALLAGGAYFLYDQPFQSSRTPSGQNTDLFEARLWEDPLSTIYKVKAIEESQLVNGNTSAIRSFLDQRHVIDRKSFLAKVHDAAKLRESKGITVMGVMMPEGGNSLSIEMRRRIRYAIISALNQSKLPSQSEQLAVLNLDLENQGPAVGELSLLSYEIYHPYSSGNRTSASSSTSAASKNISAADDFNRQAQTVVVLWIPSALLSGDVVGNYQEVLSWIGFEHDQANLQIGDHLIQANAEHAATNRNTVANAILLGPTNSNELADIYRQHGLSKKDYAEIELDETTLTTERGDLSEMLSVIEIAHSYLDYGMTESKQEELVDCLSASQISADSVEACLQKLELVDSDSNWHSWVAKRWFRQASARTSVAASTQLSNDQMESVYDLIETIDWYLDDGLPAGAAEQSAIANCGIENVLHQQGQSMLTSDEAQNHLQIELMNCLADLPITDSDSSWAQYIANAWVTDEQVEIHLEEVNEKLRTPLESIAAAADDFLDWGLSHNARISFIDCSIDQFQGSPISAGGSRNLSREQINDCFNSLGIEDSDPNWARAVSAKWPEQGITTNELGELMSLTDDSFEPYRFPRENILVFSPRATLPELLLEQEVGKNGYKEKVKPPRVFRTLASDERLLARMMDELASIRKLQTDDKNVRIALVYEGDGKYGRALQQVLDCSSYFMRTTGNEPDSAGCYPNVDSFSYLRGLDGIRPQDTNFTRADQSSSGALNSVTNLLSTPQSLEESFGRHQYDYLRRLSNEISRQEYDAIGVLGTDVYDKLLVLQALKEKNRGAVFFTTDLDATALHGGQFKWTQNLLVASALPLSLNRHNELQGNTCNYMFAGSEADNDSNTSLYAPPFRESYQTAYFQSVCLALHIAENPDMLDSDEINDLIANNLTNQELIYEVGRTKPIQLRSETASPGTAPPSQQSEPRRMGVMLSEALTTQNFRTSTGWMILMLPVILLAGLSGYSWNIEHSRDQQRKKGIGVLTSFLMHSMSRQGKGDANSFDLYLPVSWTLGASCLLSVLSLLFMLGLLILEAISVGGEPLYVLEGVSHWPTTLIRIQVLVFCAAFGLYGYARWLKSNREINWVLKKIAEEDVDDDEDASEEASIGRVQIDEQARARLQRKEMRQIKTIPQWIHYIDSSNDPVQQTMSIDEIWRVYRRLGDSKRRWIRVFPRALLWTVLVYSAYLLTPEPALVRDSFALADFLFGKWFVLLLTFISLFLISVTNDVTNLCSVFVRALTRYDIEWNDPENHLLPNGFGSYEEICKPLCVLEIIARRTRDITPLVLFPFGVLFLLVAARSLVFEGWVWSAELVVAYLMIGANSLYFAMLLQKEASAAKTQALYDLNELHTDKKHWGLDDHKHFDTCVSAAIDYANAMNKGAFVPWFKHPIFQAVLLPFTGTTGLLLLQSV